MTAAERKRKHRKTAASKQVNITLPDPIVAELDRQAKQAKQTRSELIAALISQAGKAKPKAKPKPKPKEDQLPLALANLDALGLVRPEDFKDDPGAVIVRAEVKDMPTMDMAGQQGVKWRDLPTRSMAVWEAVKHLEEFKQKHSDATISQRYMTDDKTIMEVVAVYADDRPGHRVKYQARYIGRPPYTSHFFRPQ